jgi:hypothetical protein
MAPGDPVKRLAAKVLGDDLLLDVDAERATFPRHRPSSSESPARSTPGPDLSNPRGAFHVPER